MNKYNKIMEIFWLVTSILTAFIAAYVIGRDGIDTSYEFIFFPFAAFALFVTRRVVRKRVEKQLKENNN